MPQASSPRLDPLFIIPFLAFALSLSSAEPLHSFLLLVLLLLFLSQRRTRAYHVRVLI